MEPVPFNNPNQVLSVDWPQAKFHFYYLHDEAAFCLKRELTLPDRSIETKYAC